MSEQRSEFLRVTFDGGRFAKHSVPVTVLAELTTLQQLVLRVARHLYFQHHGERKRVPQGFLEASQLHLQASAPNCFTAELLRPDELWRGATLFDRHLFEQARDTTLAALEAAANDNSLPTDFPSGAVELLVSLGRRLNDNESLFVHGGTFPRAARIDQRTRQRVAAMIKCPLEREETIEGEVEQLDDVGDKFWTRPRNGERVEVPFTSTQRAALMQALQMRPIVRARVRGLLVYAAQRRMKCVDDFELVDDDRASEVQKLWDRIELLRGISDGWLDGMGRAPTETALAQAREVLARLLVDYREVQRPKLFPTPEGGVQAEWIMGPWAAEARFPPDDEGLTLEATNGDTNEERKETIASRVSGDNALVLGNWLMDLTKPEAQRV